MGGWAAELEVGWSIDSLGRSEACEGQGLPINVACCQATQMRCVQCPQA